MLISHQLTVVNCVVQYFEENKLKLNADKTQMLSAFKLIQISLCSQKMQIYNIGKSELYIKHVVDLLRVRSGRLPGLGWTVGEN